MNQNNTFRLNINIRYRDLDPLGHANHLSILTFFEEGRVAFMREVFGLDLGIKEIANKIPWVVVNLSCNFLAQISLMDDLLLEMWVGTMKEKSFTFEYRLCDRNDREKVFATGDSVHVFFDFKNGCAIPAPVAFSEKLVMYQPAR